MGHRCVKSSLRRLKEAQGDEWWNRAVGGMESQEWGLGLKESHKLHLRCTGRPSQARSCLGKSRGRGNVWQVSGVRSGIVPNPTSIAQAA